MENYMKPYALLLALPVAALSCSKDATEGTTEDTTEDASVDVSCEEAMTEYHAWAVACGNDVGDSDLGEVLSACETNYEEAVSAGCTSEWNAGMACFAAVDWSTEECVEDFEDCSSAWTGFFDCTGGGTVGEYDDDDDYDDHAHTNAETITTLELTFESEADGSEQVVRWTDGEGAQSIVLDVGTQYALSIRPLDENEDPVIDRTEDIYEQGNFYQALFYGSVISDGLVAYTYGDEDGNGFPIGLTGGVETFAPGSGVLTVGVFFLPSDKYGDLAEQVRINGLEPYSFLFDFDPPVADFDLTVE